MIPPYIAEMQQKAAEVADQLVALLPEDAPRDMLRPVLTQNAGLMLAQYGPEAVDEFVQTMREASEAMKRGDEAGARESLAKFGMSPEMIQQMTGLA